MDCVLNVEKEIDQVIDKFTAIQKKCDTCLDNLILAVQNFQRDLVVLSTSNQCELSGCQEFVINDTIRKIRTTLTELASAHKEIHGAVSKVGKAIDKNFVHNYTHAASDSFNEKPLDHNLLNQVIVEHFLRQGMLDISEELIKEGKITVPLDKKNPFAELNLVLEGLKKHNVGPALEWAKAHRDELKARDSTLEFKLHRLQFIEYLTQGAKKQKDLLEYARKNFQSLATRHEKDMQALMGCLIYLKSGIEQSPYSHLLDPINWSEICDIFAKDASSLLGMSVESPLSVAFDAGAIALPALISLRDVILSSSMPTVWSTKDELPIPIYVGRNCQFHSIFACPILRQQSSETNPPMRLVCGHVISKDALNKLASGNKLKCPYCPLEQNPQDAIQLQF